MIQSVRLSSPICVGLLLAGLPAPAALASPPSPPPTLTAPLQHARAIERQLEQRRSQSGPPKTQQTTAPPAAARAGGDLPAAVDTDSAPKLRRVRPPVAQ